MSLGPIPPHAPAPYPYAATARYPTTPYFFATTPAGPQMPFMAQAQMMKPVSLQTPAAAGNQGAWSDEETEKLKKLSEDSKTEGDANGEIDWDWVCGAWGPGRTRHVQCFQQSPP